MECWLVLGLLSVHNKYVIFEFNSVTNQTHAQKRKDCRMYEYFGEWCIRMTLLGQQGYI